MHFLKARAKLGKRYDSEEPYNKTEQLEYSDKDRKEEIGHVTKQLNERDSKTETKEDIKIRAHLYNRRAIINLELGRFDSALADAKEGSASGIISENNSYAQVLIELKRYEDCIKFIKMMPLSTLQQRDQNFWNLYLAKCYYLKKEFEMSIEIADSIISSEPLMDVEKRSEMKPYLAAIDRMTAPALLVKAMSEYQLNQKDNSILDALTAEAEFLKISRVDCRDKVKNWRESLQY